MTKPGQIYLKCVCLSCISRHWLTFLKIHHMLLSVSISQPICGPRGVIYFRNAWSDVCISHLSESTLWPMAIFEDIFNHYIQITELILDIHISHEFYRFTQFYANNDVASNCCHKEKILFICFIPVGDVLNLRSYWLLFR